MTAPATFDPAAYVADMRAIGATLTPYTVAANGKRVFSIGAPAGIPFDVVTVGAKHEAAALAHPDWMAAVHDALKAEEAQA